MDETRTTETFEDTARRMLAKHGREGLRAMADDHRINVLTGTRSPLRVAVAAQVYASLADIDFAI